MHFIILVPFSANKENKKERGNKLPRNQTDPSLLLACERRCAEWKKWEEMWPNHAASLQVHTKQTINMHQFSVYTPTTTHLTHSAEASSVFCFVLSFFLLLLLSSSIFHIVLTYCVYVYMKETVLRLALIPATPKEYISAFRLII